MIACAGVGKTEIVARRVANLLRPVKDGGGCEPKNRANAAALVARANIVARPDALLDVWE